MDCRVIRAFTPVFDELCPAMTGSTSRPSFETRPSAAPQGEDRETQRNTGRYVLAIPPFRGVYHRAARRADPWRAITTN